MAYNSSIPFAIDTSIKFVTGVAIGVATYTSPLLWGTILAVQSIASQMLNKVCQFCFGKSFSATTISDYSTFVGHIATTAVLGYTGLISIRIAGLLGFFAFTYLCANRVSRPKAPYGAPESV